jgi:hypothetical protein
LTLLPATDELVEVLVATLPQNPFFAASRVRHAGLARQQRTPLVFVQPGTAVNRRATLIRTAANPAPQIDHPLERKPDARAPGEARWSLNPRLRSSSSFALRDSPVARRFAHFARA